MIFPLSLAHLEEEHLVGSKARQLGMTASAGIPVVRGFVVTHPFLTAMVTPRLAILASNIADALDKGNMDLGHQYLDQLLDEAGRVPKNIPVGHEEALLTHFRSRLRQKLVHQRAKRIVFDYHDNLIIQTQEHQEPTYVAMSLNPSTGDSSKYILGRDTGYFEFAKTDPLLEADTNDFILNSLLYMKRLEKLIYLPFKATFRQADSHPIILDISPLTHINPSKLTGLIGPSAEEQVPLIVGRPVTGGIRTGHLGTKIVLSTKEVPFAGLKTRKSQGFLFTGNISRDYELRLKKLGYPAIAGLGNEALQLKKGTILTINGVTGEVFSGRLKV